MRKKHEYRIVGVAYDGDPFDFTVKSPLSMLDFVAKDLLEITGGSMDGIMEAHQFWLTQTKVAVEAEGRLYAIIQLK